MNFIFVTSPIHSQSLEAFKSTLHLTLQCCSVAFTVSEMIYNVSSRTLNLTHSLSVAWVIEMAARQKLQHQQFPKVHV